MPAEPSEDQLTRVALRTARKADEPALRRLESVTYSPRASPAPPDPAPPFLARYGAENILVVTDGKAIVGSLLLGPWTTLESSRHVLEVKGLNVDPDRRRQGIGAMLLDAAIARARERGMRRLVLRVLSGNGPARGLYESRGFEVEGVRREAFLLEGAYVDDLMMGLDLTR